MLECINTTLFEKYPNNIKMEQGYKYIRHNYTESSKLARLYS